MAVSSGSHGSWWEIHCDQCLCSMCNMSFILTVLKIFSFYWFWALLCVSIFLVLRVHRASWICGFLVFIRFGNFAAIVSSICPPPPLGKPVTWVYRCSKLSHSSEALFGFFWLTFSLCFILDGLYCYVLKFISLLSCRPALCTFHLRLYCFHL